VSGTIEREDSFFKKIETLSLSLALSLFLSVPLSVPLLLAHTHARTLTRSGAKLRAAIVLCDFVFAASWVCR